MYGCCHLPCPSPPWTGTLTTAPHHHQNVQGWGCWAWCQWWKRSVDGCCAAVDRGCSGGVGPRGYPAGEDHGLRSQIRTRSPYCAGSGGWSRASSCPQRLSPAQLQREPQEQRGGQIQDRRAPRRPRGQKGRHRLPTLQRKMRRKTRRGWWSERGRGVYAAAGTAVSVPGQEPPCSPWRSGSSY